jgi:hypothetical protein
LVVYGVYFRRKSKNIIVWILSFPWVYFPQFLPVRHVPVHSNMLVTMLLGGRLQSCFLWLSLSQLGLFGPSLDWHGVKVRRSIQNIVTITLALLPIPKLLTLCLFH